MPKGMQAIYTQTVGAIPASSVIFNNIPQTYTDLYVLVSARDTGGGNIGAAGNMNITSVASTSSNIVLRNLGGSNTFGSGIGFAGPYSYINGAGTTASTFSNASFYLPNYTSNRFKQIIVDTAIESNSASIDSMNFTVASCTRVNHPITRIVFTPGATAFAQHSTFTIYGIGS
jgi:hypothetical protein